MFAYFGTMPNIVDSVTCCSRFEDRFEKVTGQKSQKNDKDIYRKLNQYGSFETAYPLAEKTLKRQWLFTLNLRRQSRRARFIILSKRLRIRLRATAIRTNNSVRITEENIPIA